MQNTYSTNNLFKLFDGLLNDLPRETTNFVNLKKTKVNITQDKDNYILDVFYPGVKKENFKVDVDDGIITIASNFEDGDWDKEDDNVFLKEYTMYDFDRKFKLPKEVIIKNIEAVYENGVLSVKIPKDKIKEKEKRKSIKID